MEIGTAEWIAIGTAAYALLSEVIGINPKWQSNSVVQITMKILGRLVGR